jgi:hypothetical protein
LLDNPKKSFVTTRGFVEGSGQETGVRGGMRAVEHAGATTATNRAFATTSARRLKAPPPRLVLLHGSESIRS